MKKYIISALTVLSLQSCQGFLDTENLIQKDNSNFPKTEEDIEIALTAVYADLGDYQGGGTRITRWRENNFALAEFMSDDRLGGGRTSATDGRALMNFQQVDNNMHLEAWKCSYSGIYKANFVLENIKNINFENEKAHNKIMGEALFLRAIFYFDLARIFSGNIPLVKSSKVDPTTPQSNASEVYGYILNDLKEAISLLPATPHASMDKSQHGEATKWAAQAFLGRVYLFYSGYYNTENVSLTDGTTMGKAEVLTQIEDCISNSGHALVSDYRNLWPYAISNIDYRYSKDNDLVFAGEENEEVVFALKYSAAGVKRYSNMVALSQGLSNHTTLPFGKGWMYCTVNPTTWDEWPDEDVRKRATIWDTTDMETENVSGFKLNNGATLQETNYYAKKYLPVTMKNASGQIKNFSVILYGAPDIYQGNICQDLVLMRFSDVLLMAAELGSSNAQSYFDEVRSRAKMPALPVNLENIKAERRFEFACEGIRYYDLLRWGDVESEINSNMKDIPVITFGKPTTLTVRFRPETGGFLAIPSSEILLSNGTLKQNPGWEDAVGMYTGE